MSNKQTKKNSANAVNIRNKRATFDYEVLDTYTAGLVLTGTEVKSLRAGKAGLTDTFCIFDKGELWVKNAYIAEYFYGTYNNHNSHRDRKLLLNRKELRNLANDSKEPGLTIVPLRLFFNEKGLAKMEIALCKGKKQYDKRDSIKEQESLRELDRAKKDFGKY
jgi:SsrA-binding protein